MVAVVVLLAVCLFAVQFIFVLQVRGRCKGECDAELSDVHIDVDAQAGLDARWYPSGPHCEDND